MKVRVSTVLLLIALLSLSFRVFNWQPVNYISSTGFLHEVLDWIYFVAGAQLLVVSFVIALLSAPVLMARRHWRGVLQCAVELAICIGCYLIIPAN